MTTTNPSSGVKSEQAENEGKQLIVRGTDDGKKDDKSDVFNTLDANFASSVKVSGSGHSNRVRTDLALEDEELQPDQEEVLGESYLRSTKSFRPAKVQIANADMTKTDFREREKEIEQKSNPTVITFAAAAQIVEASHNVPKVIDSPPKVIGNPTENSGNRANVTDNSTEVAGNAKEIGLEGMPPRVPYYPDSPDKLKLPDSPDIPNESASTTRKSARQGVTRGKQSKTLGKQDKSSHGTLRVNKKAGTAKSIGKGKIPATKKGDAEAKSSVDVEASSSVNVEVLRYNPEQSRQQNEIVYNSRGSIDSDSEDIQARTRYSARSNIMNKEKDNYSTAFGSSFRPTHADNQYAAESVQSDVQIYPLRRNYTQMPMPVPLSGLEAHTISKKVAEKYRQMIQQQYPPQYYSQPQAQQQMRSQQVQMNRPSPTSSGNLQQYYNYPVYTTRPANMAMPSTGPSQLEYTYGTGGGGMEATMTYQPNSSWQAGKQQYGSSSPSPVTVNIPSSTMAQISNLEAEVLPPTCGRRSKYDLAEADLQFTRYSNVSKLPISDDEKAFLIDMTEKYPSLPLMALLRTALVTHFNKDTFMALLSIPENIRQLEGYMDNGESLQLILPTDHNSELEMQASTLLEIQQHPNIGPELERQHSLTLAQPQNQQPHLHLQHLQQSQTQSQYQQVQFQYQSLDQFQQQQQYHFRQQAQSQINHSQPQYRQQQYPQIQQPQPQMQQPPFKTQKNFDYQQQSQMQQYSQFQQLSQQQHQSHLLQQYQQKYNQHIPPHYQQQSHFSQYPVLKSSKRDLNTERQSLRDKYRNIDISGPSFRDTRNLAIPVLKDLPTKEITSPKPAKRRKLVRKLKKSSDSEDSSNSSSNSSNKNKVQTPSPPLKSTINYSVKILEFINSCSVRELADLANCHVTEANLIISYRPYYSLEQVESIRDAGESSKAKTASLGSKVVENCRNMMEGYDAVDSLIRGCDEIGKSIRFSLESWNKMMADEKAMPLTDDPTFVYLREQPKLLAPEVTLKPYQIVGVNWLRLLYAKSLSGILADEMGLGKTCQVIAFLAQLHSEGRRGPHLIVCPASIVENWLREFNKFCPTIVVEPYYGSPTERSGVRKAPNPHSFNVLITTYQTATGHYLDRKYLKRKNFDCCIYDEGHCLKNSMSDRYRYLMSVNANFRLLLTGTPLQNNLIELVSLLAFILPRLFEQKIDKLDIIFRMNKPANKKKGKENEQNEVDEVEEEDKTDEKQENRAAALAKNDSNTSRYPPQDERIYLSRQRISRAKSMMTPFVLRRSKQDVRLGIPEKKQFVELCDMSKAQQDIYSEILAKRCRSIIQRKSGQEVSDENKGNILMLMRKAANHSLLFRTVYSDEVLKILSNIFIRYKKFKQISSRGVPAIYEELLVMNDIEIHKLCEDYDAAVLYRLGVENFIEVGKIKALKSLLQKYKNPENRILIFSQFTSVLDILENCLNAWKTSYIRMDGQTPVILRQDMIDMFHREQEIKCFLLSTKAGGYGINLACANIVILYDISFNPHDDKQAEDRAHRLGQRKTVMVHRLITKDTIDVYIQKLANMKLELDRSLIETDEKSAQTLIESMMDEEAEQMTASEIEQKNELAEQDAKQSD